MKTYEDGNYRDDPRDLQARLANGERGIPKIPDSPDTRHAVAARAAAPVAPPQLGDYQERMTVWGVKCFGAGHMADPTLRGMRLLEEAIEFAQSVGVPAKKCCALIEYVYARPAGEPRQELGGVLVTAIVAANALGEDALALLDAEATRVEAKSPEHFAARNQVKLDAGFNVAAAPRPAEQPAPAKRLDRLELFLAQATTTASQLRDNIPTQYTRLRALAQTLLNECEYLSQPQTAAVAEQPSAAAPRQIETYSLPQQLCAWLMREIPDSFKPAEILKLMNEYTEAEISRAAQREGK